MASLLLAEALLLSTILPSYALQFGGTVSGPTDADVLRPEFESDEAAREAAEEAENTAERRRQKEMWELPPELDSRTGIPLEPGCFVRTPAGCPYHPEFHSAGWKHAAHAERSTEAAIDAAACEVLWKEKVASWCGTVDVEVLFVPQNGSGSGSGSASSRTEATTAAAASQRGAASQGIPTPVTNEETATTEGKGDEQSAATVVVTAPKEPGCFMRTPSGCPNHPGSSSVEWKHDNYAERYTRATVNRSVCEEHRREELSQWCGSADVEVLFVPGVKAVAAPPPSPKDASPREPGSPKREARTEPGDGPKEPGCYVRTPSGCTNHPTLRSTAWQYEDISQAHADATASRSLCEIDQKALVAEWCGVSDVQVIFNQDGDSGAGAMSAAGAAGGTDGAGGADATNGADATGEADPTGGVDATGVADATGGAEAARVADVTRGADATRAADGTGGVDVTRGADSTVGADARRVAEGTGGADVPRVADVMGGADATGGAGAMAGAAAVGGGGAARSTVSATTPTEPGCFVRTPSGCPKVPGFHSQDWKRDAYAEEYSQAAVNRTACEVSRRAEVLALCGVQDAETLFVPGNAAPLVEPGNSSQDPTEPGCYVRTPSGCPNHPVYSSSTWKHEEYGEKAKGAKANRAVCEDERRLHVAHWCGSEDVEVLFIQEPGCFVRTPAGCPNHPSFHSELWKHEEYGENNSEAKTDRAVCEVTRREHVVHWCGAESVEMLFVPGWETLRSAEAARRPQDEPELNASARTTAAATTSTRSLSTYRPLSIVETTTVPFERTTPGPTESPTVSPSALQVDDRNRETVNSAEVQRVSGASVRTTGAATTTERSLSTFRPLPIVETTPVPFQRTTPSPTESPTVSPSALQVDAPGRETVNSAEDQRVLGASVRTTAAATTTERSLSTFRPLPIVETTPVPFQRTTPSPTESPTVSPSTLQVDSPGRETVNTAEDQRVSGASVRTTAAATTTERPLSTYRPLPIVETTPVPFQRTTPSPTHSPTASPSTLQGDSPGRETVNSAEDQRVLGASVRTTAAATTTARSLSTYRPLPIVETTPVPFQRTTPSPTESPTVSPSTLQVDSPGRETVNTAEDQRVLGASVRTTAAATTTERSLSTFRPLPIVEATPVPFQRTTPSPTESPTVSPSTLQVDSPGRETVNSAEAPAGPATTAPGPGPGAAGASRSAPPLEAPEEPGCYLRTPSGCPRVGGPGNASWRHDVHGERETAAKVNETMCEVERKARLVEWCGSQDVEMLFVPPRAPGCYTRTPTGCPNHPSFNSTAWKHDEYGENHTTAKVSRWRCELSRKLHLAHWCGTNDVRMKFVPPAWDNLIRVDERLSRNGVPPPSEPGCFVRTPSGCPAHPAFSSAGWKHVLFSVAKVHTNRTLCEVERRAYVVEWCGAQDVEVAFVPLPKAGCYVRTPKGCPLHPDSASPAWRPDEHPRGGRATCEWTRKAELQDWCGVSEVHMLYVPKARKS